MIDKGIREEEKLLPSSRRKINPIPDENATMSYAVVGGGISGLAAAHYIQKCLPGARNITVLESSERLGGWIQSTHFNDGGRHDHGPRTVRPAGLQGINTLNLVEELGLADHVLPISKSHPSAQNRFVLVDGHLHKLPSSLGSLFRRLPPFSKPLALQGLKDIFTPPKICDDDSIYEFAKRRFGEDIARYAVDPMVRGICSGDAREISAAAFVAGPMFRHEQQSGGVIKGVIRGMLKKKHTSADVEAGELGMRSRDEKWSVWSLKGGLDTLTNTLGDRLEKDGIEIKTGATINEVVRDRDGRVSLSLSDGRARAFDHVIFACPSHATANLLDGVSEASRFLREIPFVTVAVVTVEFVGTARYPGVPDGFGFLVPSSQPEPILGIIFDTCSFPQPNRAVFTVMMGGRWFPQLFGSTSAPEIERVAVDHLQRILRISDAPSRVVTKIQRDCIAQYTVGHNSRVVGARAAVRKERLNVSLAGSSYDGVGINDAILSAKNRVLDLKWT